MVKSEINKNVKEDYGVVYDISLDGTVVNALGMNVMSNTDGFNFKMPSSFKYTDENPYISKGLGRNYKAGEAYTTVDADVAEFEDLYMNESYAIGPNKVGLGVDEYVPSSINFSRKNYADLLDPEAEEVKLVGNSIKSKKMPIYIEKFLDKGIKLLLFGKGKEFLDYYYDYIDDIYNMKIPLQDIASVGKIKITLDEYSANTQTLTAAGSKKARQAWYELAIKEKLNVNMGDAIYYINTGNKKTESDVKRITKYIVNGEDCTSEIEKEYNRVKRNTDPRKNPGVSTHESRSVNWTVNEKGKYSSDNLATYVGNYYKSAKEVDEVIFNCVLVPQDVMSSEEPSYCDDNFEYNVAKYIDQFNKRIKALLVCFSKDIRFTYDNKGKQIDNILIDNPKDRKEFTEAESRLTSGEPNKEEDQDTLEELLAMEDKEIKFWKGVNRKPLFVDELEMDWDSILEDYNQRMSDLKMEEIEKESNKLIKIITQLSSEDFDNFDYPDSVWNMVEWDRKKRGFRSKKWNTIILTLDDLYDIKYGIDELDDSDDEMEM